MSTAAASPVQRLRLRKILREHRSRLELTQDQVATAMDWSLSKVIRIEAGSVAISVNDLRALLDLYRVADKDGLIELARAARKPPWWQAFRDQMSADFQYYVGLEAISSRMQHFQGMIVPGLLQTMEYAREAFIGTVPELVSDDDLEVRLAIRRHRQDEFFGQDEPPALEVVVDESVIRRVVGSPAIMRAQLCHLLDLSDRRHLVIRVVPFARGIHPGHIGPFIIMDFDHEEALESLVYLEGPLEDAKSDDLKDVARYRGIFDRLRSMALSPDETSDFIRRAASELD